METGVSRRSRSRVREGGLLDHHRRIIIPGWFFEPLRDAIGAAGFDVAYAVLRPPLAVAVERAASRRSGRVSEAAVVEQLWYDFSDLGVLERHAIDTQTQTAEQTAELVAERLEADALTT